MKIKTQTERKICRYTDRNGDRQTQADEQI